MILTGKIEVLGEKYYTALVVDDWSFGGMILTGKIEVLGEIPCHLASLFTTVLTRTDVVFNPVPQRQKPASIRLCHGTADSEGKDGIQSPLHTKFSAYRLENSL